MLKKGNLVQTMFLLLSIGILVVFVVCPMITLFSKAFYSKQDAFVGLENFAEYFTTPNLIHALYHSIFVSSVATCFAVILAFLYAYALTRTGLKGKGFYRFTGMLPLFAPTMMLGIGLTCLFGNKGILTLLGIKLPLYGKVGIILSEIFYTFPQAFLILIVSLSFADNRLYEAAEMMGASSFRKFRTITLPSVRYGIISAVFVCFSLSFTDFGAPKVIGGNYNVLATDIYKHVVGQQNFSMGAVVGILLMVPAVLSFLVDCLTENKNSVSVNAKTVDHVIHKNKKRDVFYTVYCILVNGCILILLCSVLLRSTVKMWPYDMSFTLEHYFVNSPATGGIRSYFNSLIVAVVSSVLGVIVVFVNAYLIEKLRSMKALRKTAYFLSIIPMALPGLAIGLAFIFFFSRQENPFSFLYGTMWMLVLANLVHFYSVPFVTATSALKKLDKEFESVSESMNIPLYRTFFKVTIPMSLPAIFEILIYFFVNSMVTVSAVVFLYPADFKLASIAIVNMEDAGDIASAAALSVLILLTNVLMRLLYEFIRIRPAKKTGRF